MRHPAFLPPIALRPAASFSRTAPSSSFRRPNTMSIEKPLSSSSTPPATSPPRLYKPSDNIRPDLKRIAPYTPIVPYEVLAERLNRSPSDIVKLDANENPYGPAPAVAAALANAQYLHIYPDPSSGFLRDALAEYTNLPKEYLLAGAGADELIDLLLRLFIEPGKGHSIVNCPPTFGMYKFDADVNGAETIDVCRGEGTFAVDVDAIETVFEQLGPGKYPKMVFVASPNNPDGSSLSDDKLRRLLALPTLVVLDEAYFEFADSNRISWVPKHDNLVVLRTFSKWSGLAGMRVGYGAFPLPVIEHLWKIKQPYNVSVASQIAAIASLRDKDDLLAKVDRLIAQRTTFYEMVRAFDWLTPFPSQSNYVLCRVGGGRTAPEIKSQLAERGILIRYYTAMGLADCIRISMGTEEQMERLYKALAEL